MDESPGESSERVKADWECAQQSFFQIKAPFIVKARLLTTAKELAQSYQ